MSDQDSTEEDTQPQKFNIGDYKTFLSKTLHFIFYLIIAVVIGSNMLYYFKNENYDDYINTYFPVEADKPPFCLNSDCDSEFIYFGGEYTPKYNLLFKDKKINTPQSISEYKDWILHWHNNKVINTSVTINKWNKHIFDFMRENINKDATKVDEVRRWLIMFVGGIAMKAILTICFFIYPIISYIQGFYSFDMAWLLSMPIVGAIFAIIKHSLNGSWAQTVLSIIGLCLTGIWWGIRILSVIVLMWTIIPSKILRLGYLFIKNFIWDVPIRNQLFSIISEYTKSITIIVLFIVLANAHYLNPEIATGMFIATLILFLINYFKN